MTALVGVLLLADMVLWSVAHSFGDELNEAENILLGVGIGLFVLSILVALLVRFGG